MYRYVFHGANALPCILRNYVNGADVTLQMNTLAIVPLDGLTNDGYRVVMCKLRDLDPSNYNFVTTTKLFSMVTDLWLAHYGIAEGHVIVIDMEGSTLSHLARVSLIALKKFMFYIPEALPFRLRALHFINAVSFMDKIFSMMRPFMKKEFMDVMHIHTTMDTCLDKHVPKAMMPEEYGGSAGKVFEESDKCFQQLKDNAAFFIQEEKSRVNKKLRPGKPKTEGDLFGTDGNFKQLSFD